MTFIYVSIYLFIAICTGIAYYQYMLNYDNYTEEAILQGSTICGMFWPVFFMVLIIYNLLVKLRL